MIIKTLFITNINSINTTYHKNKFNTKLQYI